jgi:phage baseplate assembly protein W
MATFIGYNTQGNPRAVTLTDFALVKQDLLNSLNVVQGELPGRPEYGSALQALLFENLNNETINQIRDELERVMAMDPRIQVDDIQIYSKENGLLVELLINVVNSNAQEMLRLFLNQDSRSAEII